MSKPKLRDSRTRSGSAGPGEPPRISQTTQEWGEDCAKAIESNFAKFYEHKLFAGASLSDYRKRMLASALLALLDEGLSRDELVDVLGSKGIFPWFVNPVSPLGVSEIQQSLFASADNAIRSELDQLETGCFETRNAGTALIPECALLYLSGQIESEPAYGSLYYRSKVVAATSARRNLDAGLATIALSERTAISRMPACDPRLQPGALQGTSACGTCGTGGSMMAIRLDDLVGKSLAVLVVCLRSELRPTDRATEESLLDELQKRCLPLRMLLIFRSLVERLVDEFVRGPRGLGTSGAAHETQQGPGLADQIDRLYERLATLNSERLERPADGELQTRIHECLTSLRQLQETEAAAIERHFARGLSLPLGDSARLIQKANELVNQYANPPRADHSTDQTDK